MTCTHAMHTQAERKNKEMMVLQRIAEIEIEIKIKIAFEMIGRSETQK